VCVPSGVHAWRIRFFPSPTSVGATILCCVETGGGAQPGLSIPETVCLNGTTPHAQVHAERTGFATCLCTLNQQWLVAW
jgi:hypothetical protein